MKRPRKRPMLLPEQHRFMLTPTIALGTLLVWMVSCSNNPSQPKNEEPEHPAIQVIHPFRGLQGSTFPVILRVRDAHPRSFGTQSMLMTGSGLETTSLPVTIRRGVGVVVQQTTSEPQINLTVGGVSYGGAVSLDADSVNRHFSDHLLTDDDLVWGAAEVIVIEGNVTVPAGAVLTISPGAQIRMGHLARLRVEGTLIAEGTADSVIVFLPANSEEPWGEIDCDQGSLDLVWTMFTGGGGDPDRSFGHSGSQPVLRCNSGELNGANLFVVGNPGKAFGTIRSIVTIDSSVISRCDTGGEHLQSLVTIENSWFLEMPDESTEPVDDDNDASYFLGAWNEDDRVSTVRQSVFVRGKDDGIDHNGARLLIEECVIEGFYHEGVACSNENSVTIRNTLVLNCGQGIEAGYGAPIVVVDHCTLLNNGVGLRFGDEYISQEHTGQLMVLNTISQMNITHNVWDYDSGPGEPSGRVSITYSMVADTIYNGMTGNLPDTAVLDEEYLLMPTSPGKGAGSDGLDIGLTP